MSLASVVLDWFQCHETLTLDLQPGVNVVYGHTGAGKTACIRALHWLCLGGPSGGFTKHGSGEVRVKTIIDGRTVRRIKSRDRNSYKLDRKTFDAVKRDVPEEIARLLDVTRVNFQLQLDPPFLLSASPPERARMLNRVVSLDLIDSTLSRLESRVRSDESAYKRAEDDLDAARARVTRLEWLQDAEEDFADLVCLSQELEQKSHRIANMAKLHDEATQVSQEARRATDAATDAANLAALAERYLTAYNHTKRLQRLIEDLRQPTPPCPPPDLHSLVKDMFDRMHREALIAELVGDIQEAQEVVCRSAHELGLAREAADQMKTGRCPRCGSSQTR